MDVFIQLDKLSRGLDRLIYRLVELSPQSVAESIDFDSLQACYLDDGAMGSLRFSERGQDKGDRKLGKKVAELEFMDADGIPVSAVLFLDEAGHLFELDIFKADFSPLITIPSVLDISS